MQKDLNRFLKAQADTYEAALAEIHTGKKLTHWMWFIFPQLKGLGFSDTSKYYAIDDLAEAKRYLKEPTLHDRLLEICQALLELKSDDARKILGSPDDRKLKSSMTLFSLAEENEQNSVFTKVLEKYYKGERDQKTLNLLAKQQ